MSEQEPDDIQKPLWREHLSASFDALPESYEVFAKAIEDARHVFHAELAAHMQNRLNAYLQTLPCETYEQKQKIASWVNNELHEKGLAIRCPKTGKPAILLADTKSGEGTASRFRMDVRGNSGSRIRTFSSRTLPRLEIIEDEIRPEPLAKHHRIK